MSIAFSKTSYLLPALTLMVSVTASAATAVTYTCDTLNGVTFNAGPAGNADVMVSLTAGQTLILTTTSTTLGAEFNESGGGNKLNCANFAGTPMCGGVSYTAQSDDVHEIEAFNGSASSFTLACGSAAMAASSTGSNLGVIAGQTGQSSANAQSNAVGSAVSSVASGRLAGNTGTLGVTASTSGSGALGADWHIWANATARRYDGTLDGSGGELSFGFDRIFGPVVAGVVISMNQFDGASGAVNTDATSYAIGPYFAAALGGNYTMDGYLTYGKSTYDVGAANFDAQRTMAGLNVRTRYALGRIQMTPFAGVRGYRETQNSFTVGATTTAANTISGVTGSIGSKFSIDTHIGTSKVTPFLSLAAEFTRFDDGLGTTSTYTAPRVALGLSSAGRAGDFNVTLDAGNVEAGTKDMSLSVSYAMRF